MPRADDGLQAERAGWLEDMAESLTTETGWSWRSEDVARALKKEAGE